MTFRYEAARACAYVARRGSVKRLLYSWEYLTCRCYSEDRHDMG